MLTGLQQTPVMRYYINIASFTISAGKPTMAGTRASLSISTPNEEWIQSQINSGEFSSRSEVVNDLIRRTREIEIIRARLIASEQSVLDRGWVEETPEQMLGSFKAKAQRDGKL